MRLSEVEVSEIESLGGCGDIQWGWGTLLSYMVAVPDTTRIHGEWETKKKL